MTVQRAAKQIRLNVAEFIGSRFCVTEEDGTRLFEELRKEICERGNRVILDFSTVRVCASPFLNFSVGAIIGELKQEPLSAWLTWENMSTPSEQLLRDVVQNAEFHFSMQPEGLMEA